VARSLQKTLDNAAKAAKKGNGMGAVGQLNAFINKLAAVAGKPGGPSSVEARALANNAQSIRIQIRGH
jgi:hypothetical protein